MKNFKTPILLTALYVLLNTGCKKTETPQLTPGFNVYMAGTVDNAAIFWKNGQSTELAASSSAVCIGVAGTDVFIGGQSNQDPVYWKNGQLNSLSPGLATVYGIALSDSDVYFVGVFNAAVYWKNGIFNSLEPNSRGSAAEGICFDGSDMYVVGHVFGDSDTAVQWKNGVRTNYTSDNGQAEIANAVAVSGADVYAAGIYNNTPVFWKNGIMHTLNLNGSSVPNSGFASAIVIVGTDVYIAGVTTTPSSGYKATYWKNGVSTNLSNNASDVSVASGIALAGSDIYVVGTVSSAGSRGYHPVYWKNGVQYNLSGTGSVNAICVGN
jgi:hypothetical protein